MSTDTRSIPSADDQAIKLAFDGPPDGNACCLETDVILALCDWFPRVVTGVPGEYEKDAKRFHAACSAVRRLRMLAEQVQQVRPLGADELVMLIEQGSWSQRQLDEILYAARQAVAS